MNGRGVLALVLQLGFLTIALVGRTEPYLRTAMPDWTSYARRVGRFVPGLGRSGG